MYANNTIPANKATAGRVVSAHVINRCMCAMAHMHLLQTALAVLRWHQLHGLLQCMHEHSHPSTLYNIACHTSAQGCSNQVDRSCSQTQKQHMMYVPL
jgi:hypothetical protein